MVPLRNRIKVRMTPVRNRSLATSATGTGQTRPRAVYLTEFDMSAAPYGRRHETTGGPFSSGKPVICKGRSRRVSGTRPCTPKSGDFGYILPPKSGDCGYILPPKSGDFGYILPPKSGDFSYTLPPKSGGCGHIPPSEVRRLRLPFGLNYNSNARKIALGA